MLKHLMTGAANALSSIKMLYHVDLILYREFSAVDVWGAILF